MTASEVHAQANEVISFWFDGVMPEQRFARSRGLDAMIESRFGDLRAEVVATRATAWRDGVETLLAAVILIDQFSRNMFRGSAQAFADDPLARELALLAIDRGWDSVLSGDQRQFLYMPLMHAEDSAMQALSIVRFTELGQPLALDFAHQHAEVIARFGRFPSRNAALGRESTPEEVEYLSQPGAGW